MAAPRLNFRGTNVIDHTTGLRQAFSNVGGMVSDYENQQLARDKMAAEQEYREKTLGLQRDQFGLQQDKAMSDAAELAKRQATAARVGEIIAAPTIKDRRALLDVTAKEFGGFNPTAQETELMQKALTPEKEDPKKEDPKIAQYNYLVSSQGVDPKRAQALVWRDLDKSTGKSGGGKKGSTTLVTENPEIADELYTMSSRLFGTEQGDKEMYAKNKQYLDNAQQLLGKEYVESNWKRLLDDPMVGRSEVDTEAFKALGKDLKVVTVGTDGKEQMSTVKDAFQAMALKDPKGNMKYNIARAYNPKTGKTDIRMVLNPEYKNPDESRDLARMNNPYDRESVLYRTGMAPFRGMLDFVSNVPNIPNSPFNR